MATNFMFLAMTWIVKSSTLQQKHGPPCLPLESQSILGHHALLPGETLSLSLEALQ